MERWESNKQSERRIRDGREKREHKSVRRKTNEERVSLMTSPVVQFRKATHMLIFKITVSVYT